jgi:hypothetical protein
MTLLLGLSFAQEITFDFDDASMQQAGLDPDDVESALGGSLSTDLHLADQFDYLQDMAIAAALSSHGMGVDYGSNPQKFVIGGSVGSAVSGAGAQFGRGDEILPEGGFAFQVSAMAGVNLGALAEDDSFFRRFVVYGNGMALDTRNENFEGRLENYGGHLQVQLVKPRIGKLAEWGGLAVTGGYEASNYSMILTSEIPLSEGDLTWNARGTYDISATSWSVPVEVSTNVRLAMLTLYAGVGQDFAARTRVDSGIAMTGPVTTQFQGNEVTIANLHVGHTDTVSSVDLLPRGFAGVQMNLFMVKAYGHLNATLDGGFGGNVGLRVAL